MAARFLDRADAGRALARELSEYRGRGDVIVLGLPRGGVPVAFEVARALEAPLDVFVVRKLGVPGHEEVAMGAIASGGVRLLNPDVVDALRIPEETVAQVEALERVELERRERRYRGSRPFPDLAGKTVILVDDGLATGASMRAAVEALRLEGPRGIVVAVPVAAPETCDAFRDVADEIVCAVTPEPFHAVGLWYADFLQTTDEEVQSLLDRATAKARGDSLEQRLRAAALPLASPSDLDPLLERIGDARFVLLGEATHGTSEFYTWRTELSKRLIRERGFSFIGVEGDWPDCYRVNRYVKALPDSGGSAEQVLHAFARWPSWMWANREVAELTEWLREHNRRRPAGQQVGFYGLDVYSLWDSMAAVVEYLERIDPAAARAARGAYACFDPYYDDVQEYARATALVPTSCEDEAVEMLHALRARAPEYREDGRDAYFNAEQNALVARNAELYYRTMVRGGPTSWNVRDHHMVETLDRLMAHHGPGAKAIVWEHNTHIGDARFTDMARAGMVNVGQLVRQAHGEGPEEGEGVVLVGFGTYRGSVIAGAEWGAPMQRMRVPEARLGSFEHLLHRSGAGDALLLFDGSEDGGIPGLAAPVEHRAIGVVYDPRAERWGNYVPTVLPRRYDAFLYLDETRALDPLHISEVTDGEPPETYPTGM